MDTFIVLFLLITGIILSFLFDSLFIGFIAAFIIACIIFPMFGKWERKKIEEEEQRRKEEEKARQKRQWELDAPKRLEQERIQREKDALEREESEKQARYRAEQKKKEEQRKKERNAALKAAGRDIEYSVTVSYEFYNPHTYKGLVPNCAKSSQTMTISALNEKIAEEKALEDIRRRHSYQPDYQSGDTIFRDYRVTKIVDE